MERKKWKRIQKKREMENNGKKYQLGKFWGVSDFFFWGDLFGLYRVIWSLAMLISWLVITHSFCFLNLNLRFSELSTHCDHMEVYSNTSVWISPSRFFFYVIWVQPAIVVFKAPQMNLTRSQGWSHCHEAPTTEKKKNRAPSP